MVFRRMVGNRLNGGAQADPHGDLTTELERELGKLVKQRHNTDFYILTRYPLAVRSIGRVCEPNQPC